MSCCHTEQQETFPSFPGESFAYENTVFMNAHLQLIKRQEQEK